MDCSTPLLWLDRQAPVFGWGPGARAVIWLPAKVTAVGANPGSASELADWVCTISGIAGLTLVGGEPLAQSRGAVTLIRMLKERQPELTYICHTVFTWEQVNTDSHAWRRVLLENLDVLVCGAGTEPRDPIWGGLAGQQVVRLNGRCQV